VVFLFKKMFLETLIAPAEHWCAFHVPQRKT